uniref:Unk zinc finger n=1 Tax=Lates calcarifer TaxID=8187 RepID=A0A4W6FA18_LATCA
MSKTHSQPPSSSAATATGGPSSSSSSSPAGGSTSPATVLNVQPEKPQHYTYLKEFRTEQCPLFVQHKCTQHRPFSCFHWHFLNQRRRRPIRRRDGTFNYSPDVYCTKYDEGTGTCPDGDECPFLHRTAGDTERRYHLRYYKTGSCIHETDAKGHCSKNGSHCAFAHGSHDLRSPVYDISHLQSSGSSEGGGGDGQSGQAASTALIEKILSEEPRWQDNNYVLSHYKTELCKKPPRLCRQGYACPYYHNSKDRRRSPHKHKYRALPCPAVKQSEEWGDPSKCEGAEGCQYCHTRTEQQFHPEIYKSTKCNDMQQCGSCPRGPFCAFAHVESKFPQHVSEQQQYHHSVCHLNHTLFFKPPQSPLYLRNHRSPPPDLLVFLPVGSPLSLSSSIPSSLAATPPSPAPLGPPGSGVTSGMNANALPFYPTSETVESVVGKSGQTTFLTHAVEKNSTSDRCGSVCVAESTARITILLRSPVTTRPIREHLLRAISQLFRFVDFDSKKSSGAVRDNVILVIFILVFAGLNGMSTNIWEHFPSGQGSPGTPPTLLPSGPCAETARLKQELEEAHRGLKQWGHSWRHTAQVDASFTTQITTLTVLQPQSSKHFPLFVQVVYRKQRQCCVTCGEPGSVSLPCGHGLQCESCSSSTECPLCPEQNLEQQLS